MAHKIDARRMFFLAERANKMFTMLKGLDDLIAQMDDVGHLQAAHDLIEKRWESEMEMIEDFQRNIDEALASKKGDA